MVFRIASSPYTHNQRQTSRIMLLVLLAAVPGIVVQTWFFGWGTVLQIVLAALTAWATEAAILKLRKQPVAATLKDNSALLTWPAAGGEYSATGPVVDGGARHCLCRSHCQAVVRRPGP